MGKKLVIVITAVLLTIIFILALGCGKSNQKTGQGLSNNLTEPTKAKENYGFIIGTEVNARDKGSKDGAVVGTYDFGEKVLILAEDGEWAKVRRTDERECYVFKKYLGNHLEGFKILNKGSIAYIVGKNGERKGYRYSQFFSQQGADNLNFSAIVPDAQSSQKVLFNEGKEVKWETDLNVNEIFESLSTMQVQDMNSGKIFYTVGRGIEAYIISYDSKTRNAKVELNSKNYFDPFKKWDTGPESQYYTYLKDIIIKDYKLYLVLWPSEPRKMGAPVAYRLIWNEKDNKFDNEYVENKVNFINAGN